jgi:1,4-dihydroxy-2-naphthoate octaprenyltransferase
MPAAEPTRAALSNPVVRYFLATRPPFLTVTVFGCLIGLATAWYDGVPLQPGTAMVTVLFALVAHAGINVLNDYYDAIIGTDAINTDRVFPFTGGSRFIQNEVLTLQQAAAYGFGLLGVVVAAGLWLTWIAGPGLLWIGLAGLTLGWAYSAPPLQLNSRGWGELCVAIGFALLAIGADFVQRHAFAPLPFAAVACYGLLVTNILYINQFPDRRADEATGKHHWVVRLGARKARWGYVAIALIGYGWVALSVLAGILPAMTLVSLLAAVPTAKAATQLVHHAGEPKKLAPAIQATIGAASLHGILMAASLVAARVIH